MTPPTAGTIDSASTILVESRDRARAYLVLRGATQRAFPGTHVFPGGRIDADDAQVGVLERAPGTSAAIYAAACRELFEEVGVLLAARPDGQPVDPSAPLDRWRRELLAGTARFPAVLEAAGLQVDGRALIPLGIKTTPPFAVRRFRNQFFLGVLPQGQQASVIPGELESGEWVDAADAVARFEAGRFPLAPPVLLLLEELAGKTPAEALPALAGFSDEAFAERPVRMRFSPEVITFPGRTPTLPPATHTNTYIVGADRLLVVDPATPDEHDRAKLALLLSMLANEGRRVEAVVLTHHHVDHIGAVDLVTARTGAPVWMHAHTAKMTGIAPGRLLEDGDVLDLGAGGPVRVLHTPGHTQGHLCLHQQKFDALIVGDMVSTVSTIVIDPPEGDLFDYLASLARLQGIPASILYPAHGSPTNRVAATLAEYVAHRGKREAKLVAALTEAPATIEQLVVKVYDDVAPGLHGIASRSLLAGLLKLSREGRAGQTADGSWQRR